VIDSKGERFLSVNTLKTLVYDSSFRSKFIQGLAIVIVFSIGYYLFSNIVDNLRQMELPFGFGFISSTAGFDIGWSIIPYDPSMSYGRVYLVGIVNTLILSTLIIIFSLLFFRPHSVL
jgi:general L-amino acid transport system permease protein